MFRDLIDYCAPNEIPVGIIDSWRPVIYVAIGEVYGRVTVRWAIEKLGPEPKMGYWVRVQINEAPWEGQVIPIHQVRIPATQSSEGPALVDNVQEACDGLRPEDRKRRDYVIDTDCSRGVCEVFESLSQASHNLSPTHASACSPGTADLRMTAMCGPLYVR